jgi:hypothetical protein
LGFADKLLAVLDFPGARGDFVSRLRVQVSPDLPVKIDR